MDTIGFNSVSFQQVLEILAAKQRLIFSTIAITVVTTIIAGLLLPAKYTATTTLVIQYKLPAESDPRTEVLAPDLQLNYMSTQVAIISSHHVAARVVDRLKLVDNPGWQGSYKKEEATNSIRDWAADKLLESLRVDSAKDSRVVTISYTSGKPKLSADVANAFAAVYDTTNLDLSTTPARKSAEQYNSVLSELRDKVDRAQSDLNRYQQENNIVNIDENFDVETTRLTGLAQKAAEAQGAAKAAVNQLQQLEAMKASGQSLDTLPDVFSNVLLNQLRADLGEKEAELAQISTGHGKGHPAYQRAAQEVGTRRARIAAELATVAHAIENRAKAAESLEEDLRKARKEQIGKVMELKRVRDRIPALTRAVENAEANYDSALSQYNLSLIESRLTQTNVVSLDPALVPTIPSFPKWKVNIVLSFVLGAILALGLAIVSELRNRKVSSEADLEATMGNRLIVTLPSGNAR